MEKLTLNELQPGSLVEVTSEMRSAMGLPSTTNAVIYRGGVQHWSDPTVTTLNFATHPINPGGWFNWEHKKPLTRLSGIEEQVAQIKKSKNYPPPSTSLSMLIGSDPEIFIANSRGRLIPAWEFLGAKASGISRYWDGFQAEFTTEARSCLMEYIDGLGGQLNRLKDAAVAHTRSARFLPNSVVDVDLRQLASLEEKYVQFGCKPSINPYGDRGEVVDGRLLPKRFAGGHIHAGFRIPHKPWIEAITCALDGLVALPAVGMAASLDDPIRRRFYGRAGEIRLPTHGLEYRVLSNFWLIHPALTHIVHEMFRVAIRFGITGFYSHLFTTPQDEVRRIINECDVTAARRVVAENEGLFKHLNAHMNTGSDPQYLLTAIYKGIEYVLPSMDINRNWQTQEITRTLNKSVPSSGNWSGGSFTWGRLTDLLSKEYVQPVMA